MKAKVKADGRRFQSQLQRGEIDDTAEREGTAIKDFKEKVGESSGGRPRRKGIKDISREIEERRARKLVVSERPRNSFKKTGI